MLVALAAGLVLYARTLPLSLPGVESELRVDFEWVGEDSRSHVYLGDYDSYLWLRHARTLLETGTPCDAVVDGACWDRYAAAPAGRETSYARTLHVYALAGLHRISSWFVPGQPLSVTAYWLPVLVGTVGVVPAFAIGARLAGPVAGFSAAVLIGLNALFLRRSIGADNDVWNVVLPLFAVWGAMVALAGLSRERRAAGAAGAALATGLHAATWSGWTLTAVVVALGLAAGSLHRIVAASRGGGRIRSAIGDAAVVLSTFATLSLAAVGMAGEAEPLAALPAKLVGFLARVPTDTTAVSQLAWPNVFQTVGELAKPNIAMIANSLDGAHYFFVSWLGLLVLVLPERDWRWWHFVVLLVGNFLYLYVLRLPGASTHVVISLLTFPLLAAIVLDLAFPHPHARTIGAEDDGRAASLVVVVWFIGALAQAWGAIRFVMLLVPPFGIALGVALGRLHAFATRVWVPRAGRYGSWLRPATTLAVVSLLVPPLGRGIAEARRYRPAINDAWWDTLSEIRETSPSDAIVTTWWDYGHWVKYVSDRRTTADGSTLLTHTPYWIARMLVAPSEAEALGLLRMLNCGSASSADGAWSRLVAHGQEPIAAHRAVIELARRDRVGAASWLKGRGLASADVDDVLARTHCEAPASYLVLSSRLLGGTTWRRIGSWDPVREWLARAAETGDRRRILTDRFGVDPADAAALIAEFDSTRSSNDVEARFELERSQIPLLVHDWLPCDLVDSRLRCDVDMSIDPSGPVLVQVQIDPIRPENALLRIRGPNADVATDSPPVALVIARPDGSIDVREAATADDSRIAVLVDLPKQRILVGGPEVIASTFTRLWFLDGHADGRFARVDDRRSLGGERVVTWRVQP